MANKNVNERQEYRGENGEKIFEPTGINDKGLSKISCVNARPEEKEFEIVPPSDESIQALKEMGTVSESMTIPANTNEVIIENESNKETRKREGTNGEIVSVTIIDINTISKTLQRKVEEER